MVSVSIIMDRDFESFSDQDRDDFLEGLAQVAGTPVSAMGSRQFRSGCVVFEAELDRAAVARLVELWEAVGDATTSHAELTAFREFIEKHDVVQVHRIELRVAVPTASKRRHAVFAHGWRGDAHSFGELPGWIRSSLGCDASVYQYPTGVWAHSP